MLYRAQLVQPSLQEVWSLPNGTHGLLATLVRCSTIWPNALLVDAPRGRLIAVLLGSRYSFLKILQCLIVYGQQIQQSAYVNGQWASDALAKGGFKYDIHIPKNIAPGDYVRLCITPLQYPD